MASKVTFVSGQSIEVPGHGWLKRGIEIVRECDEEVLESPELFRKFTDHYYEVADLTVQAALWKWVAAHPTPAPVGPLVRDRDDPNRARDRAIEEARQPREPQAAAPSYHNGNGYQRQQHDWNRGGGAPAQRPSGGGNRDGNPYRPRTGKELFGWTKDRETEGREGFFKAVSKYAKDKFRAWKFEMLTDQQAMDVLDVAEQWIAESN